MKRQRVNSSNIAEIGYDKDNEILEIAFIGGGVYQYDGVPEDVYNELMEAGSHGSFFYRNIRSQFAYRRIQ